MKRVRSSIAALAVVTIAGVGVVGLASTAGAQTFIAEAELIGITENLWEITTPEVPCTNDDPVVDSVTVDGTPVDIVSQETIDATTVQVLLPADAPAGEAVFEVGCASDDQGSTADEEYASLAVTKVVNGPAPEGTTFTVAVACSATELMVASTAAWGDGASVAQDPEPFDVELEYGAAGGVAYVYTDGFRECDITEPGTGGATSTTIEVDDELFFAPANYDATVTNVFPIVVEPTFTG